MAKEIKNPAAAVAYLKRFGYLDSETVRGLDMSAGTPDSEVAQSILRAAVAEFQRMANLRPTGQMDAATYKAMSSPRCGVTDGRHVGAVSRSPRFVAFGTLWQHGIITYSYGNMTADITDAQQKVVIETAFARWATVVPLEFRQVTSNGDIVISFETDDHGDGSSFDGAGSVLAHAFYPPPNGGQVAGDVHFDDAETWQEGFASGGFDMLSVAVHELGHALGLSHTDVPNSTMNPFYPTPTTPANDDRAGIREIYREQIWIASLYRDVLGRRYEADGFDGWVRRRFAGVAPEGIAHGFVFSREHCVGLATDLYFRLLDRAPDPDGLAAWTRALQSGVSRQETMLGFLTSTEYLAKNPVAEQFVYSLYRRLLEREPEPEGFAYWIGRLANGATPTDVTRGFLYSEEYARLYSRGLYQYYLRREPEEAGWKAWSDALRNGVSQQEVVIGFVASPEYRGNCPVWW